MASSELRLSLLDSRNTYQSTTQSQSFPVHRSIQNESLDGSGTRFPKSSQSPTRQRCYGSCTRLKTAFRFNDDALETQFVREQYRTPCFMRVATVFGVIQILIAPSTFYNLSFWSLPGIFSTTLFKTVLVFVLMCGTGGFLLTIFSRLRQTHHWWTVIGVFSSMLIFFGYYSFTFVSHLLFPGDYYVAEEDELGQLDVVQVSCNQTMFISSRNLLADLRVAIAGQLTRLVALLGVWMNACLHRQTGCLE